MIKKKTWKLATVKFYFSSTKSCILAQIIQKSVNFLYFIFEYKNAVLSGNCFLYCAVDLIKCFSHLIKAKIISC